MSVIRRLAGYCNIKGLKLGCNFESELQPLFEEKGLSPTEELIRYYEVCVPSVKLGWTFDIHSIDSLKESVLKCEPGSHTFPLGFCPIAAEGDGSQISYCLHSGRVISVEVGAVRHNHIADIEAASCRQFPSILEFFRFADDEARDLASMN
jgi:hypothetical protein